RALLGADQQTNFAHAVCPFFFALGDFVFGAEFTCLARAVWPLLVVAPPVSRIGGSSGVVSRCSQRRLVSARMPARSCSIWAITLQLAAVCSWCVAQIS